ncbi:mitofusin, partial [Kickxella alabastrina]
MNGVTREEQELQQHIFADKCRRLHSHLLGTKNLLRDIGDYNRTKWPVHYPLARIARAREAQAIATSSSGGPSGLRRTNSMVNSSEATLINSNGPNRMRRSMTTDDMSEYTAGPSSSEHTASDPDDSGRLLDPNDLSVLKLDLRLSYHAGSDVMGSLEESSIARLFDERLSQCEVHIDKLIARVTDKSSKILVTGDLNAGKSTL